MAAITPSTSITPLPFTPNGLYILLLDRGDTYLFHWQIYLHTSNTTGTTYEITNDNGPGGAWEYETTSSASHEIESCRHLLLALQIGELPPVLHSALSERLGQVPRAQSSSLFREGMSCRVWVKEALFALDDEGYLSLGMSGPDIEEEAKYLAMVNKSKGRRSVVRSRACLA